MEYVIFSDRDTWALEAEVNARLKQGWRLVGGVAVEVRGIDTYYSQAMLKGGE